VVLSGRVLVYEWSGGGVLLRAERQTVVRIGSYPSAFDDLLADIEDRYWRRDDPDGTGAKLPAATPRGSGPIRLRLPVQTQVVGVADDAGWCQFDRSEIVESTVPTLARVKSPLVGASLAR
jgi:hypothetical protein